MKPLAWLVGMLAAAVAACSDVRPAPSGPALGSAVARVRIDEPVAAEIGRALDFTAIDSTLYVLDGLAHQIVQLARVAGTWRPVRTFGRKGNGPGEMTEPAALEYDQRAALITLLERSGEVELFDSSGAYVRSESLDLPCFSARSQLMLIDGVRLVAQRCYGNRFDELAGDTVFMVLALVAPGRQPRLLAAQAVSTLRGEWGSIYTADAPLAVGRDSLFFGAGLDGCMFRGAIESGRLARHCDQYVRFTAPEPAGFAKAATSRAARWPVPLPLFVALASTTALPVLLRMIAEDSVVVEPIDQPGRYVAVLPLNPLVGCGRAGCLLMSDDESGVMLRWLTPRELALRPAVAP